MKTRCPVYMLTILVGIAATGAFAQDPTPQAGRGQPRPLRVIERIRDEHPEEFERLSELRKEDPEAFRREVHRLLEERRKRSGDGDGDGEGEESQVYEAKLQTLVREYREATSDEAKAKIRVRIRSALDIYFDKRLEQHEKMLDAMESRLDEMRMRLKERRQNRDAIIDNKLDSLLLDPELKW